MDKIIALTIKNVGISMNKIFLKTVSASLLSLMYCSVANADLQRFYEESTDSWDCGYKNSLGEVVVPTGLFEACGEFSDGLAYVGKIKKGYDEEGNLSYKNLQGFIDNKGRLVIPVEHEANDTGMDTDYKSFSEGLVAVYRNGKYGYMNKQRELIIPYQYQSAEAFQDGLAVVSLKEKYGAIDQSGKTIVPFKFNFLHSYSDGLAQYTESNHWNNGSQYGFVDTNGNISIKAKWDRACDFSEGLAAVRVGDYETGKWGVIDKSGNFIVEPKYDAPNIQTWSDAYYDDCYYKEGKINMYQYTDASKPHESSITRYTLDNQGNVISETFYANWDAVIKKYEFQSW